MRRTCRTRALRSPDGPEQDARRDTLVDRVEGQHDRVIVTRNGRAAAVLISADDLESLEETLAILCDRAMLEKVREGRAAIVAGDSISLEELRAQLDRPPAA